MANPFEEVGSQLAGGIFNSILLFGVAFILIVVLGVVMYYFVYYRRKFDIEVKIISERSGETSVFFDKAAILYDRKTKTKFFRLLSTKVDLSVPKFEVLQKAGRKDYLELYRKSEDDFRYLLPPKIIKTHIIKEDGKAHALASVEQRQLEPDIYWFFTRKDRLKKLFDTEGLLMKVLPYIPHIVGGVILIFVLWVLMDKLPTVLSALEDITRELRTLKGADVITTNELWRTMF